MKLPFPEKINVRLYQSYRRLLWHSPLIHKYYLRFRGFPLDMEDFDLVVQGFARSGNTFVSEAIRACMGDQLRVFSHLHVPVVIVEAMKAGKPVCFLIRNPEDAVASLALHSDWSVERCLDHYIKYHEMIERYADRMAIFEFSQFTADINCLFQGLNQLFGTNLPLTSHEEVQTSVFNRIENNQLSKLGKIDESTVNRPSNLRAKAKSKLIEDIRDHPKKLDCARSLFESFCNHSVRSKQATQSQSAV